MAGGYFSMDGVSVGYHGSALIHDIVLDIQKGEIVTLIGPNGAGKSTILKSITKQLKLIDGNVVVGERDLGMMSFRELSSQMAVVLTDRIHPELMTCHDIVATGRYPYTNRLGLMTREDEDKVDAAMAAVNAREIGGRDFNAISDGQKQRVLLARAICQEPDVMILDEPTSFLDIKYKLELLSILQRMSKQNDITVIMSLHEIDLAEKISDKIICVRGDTIFAYGRPEEIFREERIRALYDIDNGFFDPCLGNLELPGPVGEADTLVLSACGTGIPVYRRLQKQDTPFHAGILYTNDIDYRLARLLAAGVIEERPFRPISEASFQKAVKLVRDARCVIDAGITYGPDNACMKKLIELAERMGKRSVWHGV